MKGILSLKIIIENATKGEPLEKPAWWEKANKPDLALFLIGQLAKGLQNGGGARWPTDDEEVSND